MYDDLGHRTIHELMQLMIDEFIHPKDILNACRENNELWEDKIHAFRESYFHDSRLSYDLDLLPAGFLGGIPFAHKDNISAKGLGTFCCSRILEGYVPPYDAQVTERLIAAGGLVVGRSNMDEFGMGSSNEFSAFGPSKNPWNPSKVPGGSSGGSAAAVASGQAIFATGTDTGGSVRGPAAFCNLVGLRPTYGRVSRYGLVAFASSLDQVGPICRDVRDCAIVYSAISGYDDRDSTSAPRQVEDPFKEMDNGIADLRVGFLTLDEESWETVEGPIRKSFEEWKDFFKKHSKGIREIELPSLKYLLSSYYIIAPSEASSNLARFDGIRYGPTIESDDLMDVYKTNRGKGFGPEVKRRIMIGTYALSSGYYDAYYLKAQKVRTRIRDEFDEVFKDVDIIISPTTPELPFDLGSKLDDPTMMYLSDYFVIPQALAGLPAISIQGGFSEDGLPIGLQITGRPFDEATILRAGRAFEREHDYTLRKPAPPISEGGAN